MEGDATPSPTNHANFALPDNQVRSGAFGTVGATTTQNRQIQFGIRVLF
ncbi:MAG: hypothetical protein HY235_17475 [Acidobacteria bacterium]|nr:hypothetical protein [Acidobacteriota bacterium]